MKITLENIYDMGIQKGALVECCHGIVELLSDPYINEDINEVYLYPICATVQYVEGDREVYDGFALVHGNRLGVTILEPIYDSPMQPRRILTEFKFI